MTFCRGAAPSPTGSRRDPSGQSTRWATGTWQRAEGAHCPVSWSRCERTTQGGLNARSQRLRWLRALLPLKESVPPPPASAGSLAGTASLQSSHGITCVCVEGGGCVQMLHHETIPVRWNRSHGLLGVLITSTMTLFPNRCHSESLAGQDFSTAISGRRNSPHNTHRGRKDGSQSLDSHSFSLSLPLPACPANPFPGISCVPQ